MTGLRKYEAYHMLVFRTLYSNMVSPTKELGRVLTELALSSGEGRTIGNMVLRKIGRVLLPVRALDRHL